MTTKMKTALAAAALISGLAISAPASAATFMFTPGGSSPTGGFTVVNAFDSAAGLIGANFQIKTPPADGDGAPPANSVPSGTPYLAVQGGGSATFNFLAPVSAFQFDWGSIDGYNTLGFFSNQGGDIVIPGSDFTNTPANGNQVAAGTNGLFTVTGATGEFFTSVTFASSQNSFEVDNLAAVSAVPEPATWAMMLIGFGAVGHSMRKRRTRTTVAFA